MSLPQITAPVVRDGVYDPGRYFPDVEEFTFRDGVTRAELTEIIRFWIIEQLIPFLNTQVELIDAGRQTSLDQLTDAVNEALASQADAVNAAVQQMVTGQVAVNDAIVTAIINKVDSTTRALLDQRYAVTDARVAQILTSGDTHASLDVLDSRYFAKPKPGRNGITGWFHASDYGAVNNLGSDSTAAIQAAIDAAALAYPSIGVAQRVLIAPGVYQVSPVDMKQSNGNVDGITCLEMKSGVELYGPGAHLRLKNNAYGNGAYFGMIRSKYEGLVDAGIVGVAFDGSRGNQVQSTNAGNILLEALRNVWVRDVASFDSNGNAIMVRGNAYGDFATNVEITRCRVDGANGVGIQASQFNGLLIAQNEVRNTTDNSIDVYGEYGNNSTTSHGVNFQVNDNRCYNGLVGLFFETVAYGVAVGNRVSNMTQTGVRVNRINGVPTSIAIKSNGIYGCPVGIAFSGDMDAVSFTDNEVQGATVAAVNFDGLRCSGVFGDGNLLNGANDTVPLIQVTSYCQQFTGIYIDRTMTRHDASPKFVNYAQSTSASTVALAHGPGF